MSFTDNVRNLEHLLEIKWDGVSWTDESDNLLSASGVQGSVPIWRLLGGSQPQQPWTATFTLKNVDNRYSPTNSSSPIYAYTSASMLYGIPIRFSMIRPSVATERVFTGYIDTSGSSAKNLNFTLHCVDNAHPLMQSRQSTTLYEDQRVDEMLVTLADLVGIGAGARDFDTGLFVIPFSWLDEESVWTEMNMIAQSEGGTVYFDRNGDLIFESQEAWLSDTKRTTSQHTFLASNIFDVMTPFDWKNVYNRVLVQYEPREISGTVRLYENREPITLQPGQTRTVVMRLSRPASSIESFVNETHYVIVNAGGSDLSGDVTITPTTYAQRVVVEFENTGSELAYVNRFDIYGTPLVGAPTMDRELDAADSDVGDPASDAIKLLEVGGNPYIQTIEQAEFLSEILRDRVKTARQIYRINGKGYPTLQPLDRVTIQESKAGLNHTGYIQRVSWSYAGAYNATYEIIDDTSWLLFDISDYFVIETSAFDDSHRAYY